MGLVQRLLQGLGGLEITLTREKVEELSSGGLALRLLNSRGSAYNNPPVHYFSVLTDSPQIFPFVLDEEAKGIAAELVRGKQSEREKAMAIYSWVQDNIGYSKDKSGYRNSIETLRERKGVCGSMAFLYIAMARAVGLKASYASVERDFQGKRVCHGCAAVELPEGWVLVDPAYGQFGIRHRKYQILDDALAAERYRAWKTTKAS